MHPRITLNFAALPPEWTLGVAVERVRAGGFRRVGVTRHAIDAYGVRAGIELLRTSGVETSYIVHRGLFSLDRPELWKQQHRHAIETIEAAAELGAPIAYATTGSGGQLEWEQAASRFLDAVGPVVERARELGIELLLETTNPQFADIDILHTLADTVAVARQAGAGVCIDVHGCWTCSGLRATVTDAMPDVGLVQISDYVAGERTLSRSVPGDGMIPIERIVRWVLDARYSGLFDLELWRLRSDDPVAESARAAAWLGELLERLS